MIFVTGVAIGSRAEAAGVVPGQRLVALSDPVNDGDLWFLDGTERLAFVQDAIRSTRQYECTIVLESEVTVTKEAVDAVRPPPREETRPEARAAPPRATPEQLGFTRPPPRSGGSARISTRISGRGTSTSGTGSGTSSPSGWPSSSPSPRSSPRWRPWGGGRCGTSRCFDETRETREC